MLQRNMGCVDRGVRTIAGCSALLSGLVFLPGTAIGLVLDIFGSILLVTGFSGVCVLYIPLAFSTRRADRVRDSHPDKT
jgi:hypothetical protein